MKKPIKKKSRNEVLKIRYQVYRKLGYDSRTSRALSQRSLDVSGLEISKRTGKLKQNKTTKQFIEKDMKVWKRKEVINEYQNRTSEIKNDTVYTRHGMLTHDKRYKGETGKIVSIIKHENRITTKQAFYFYYIMMRYNLSYEETQKQMMSNKEFEMYAKRK